MSVDGGNQDINTNNTKPMKTDRFGRKWDIPTNELCPTCGDCSHDPLLDSEVVCLGGRIVELEKDKT